MKADDIGASHTGRDARSCNRSSRIPDVRSACCATLVPGKAAKAAPVANPHANVLQDRTDRQVDRVLEGGLFEEDAGKIERQAAEPEPKAEGRAGALGVEESVA